VSLDWLGGMLENGESYDEQLLDGEKHHVLNLAVLPRYETALHVSHFVSKV